MSEPTPKRKHLPIVSSGPPATSGAGEKGASAPVAAPPAEKRRLPMVPSAPASHRHPEPEEPEDETPDRPPWHWAGLGAIAVFFAWLPLAALVGSLVARLLRGEPPSSDAIAEAPLRVRLLMIGLHALSFAIASALGGFLVGRFGGRAGRWEALASGAVAGGLAWAIAFAQAPKTALLVWLLLLVAIAGLGAAGGYAGGRIGLSRRPPEAG